MALFWSSRACRLLPLLLVLLSGAFVWAEKPVERRSPEQQRLQQALEQGRRAAKGNHPEQAIRAFEEALPLAQQVHGDDDVRTGHLLNQLALQYERTHQYPQAVRCYQRSLAIYESRQPGSANLATVLCNLGRTQAQQKEYGAAIVSYQRSLEIREDKLGADHAEVATVVTLLANAYFAQGKYEKAEPLYLRSLRIRQTGTGTELAAALIENSLGNLYKARSRYQDAERFYQQALEVREEKLGKDHLLVAESLNDLANLYENMARYPQAEPLYQRTLKIREEKLGANHLQVAGSLNNLALLYKEMGQYARAEPLFQRSLKIWEDKLGLDHPQAATTLNNLANLYRTMGQYAQAEPLYQRSLKIREEKLGLVHLDVANSLGNLAALYQDWGQYARAEPLYQRCLKINEDRVGPNHPHVANCLHSLAYLYLDMGQYVRAEPLFQRSLQIREEKLGKDHPLVARTLSGLASTSWSMGQRGKAELLYQRSLQIREKSLGANHPDVARSLTSLASLYKAMGQPDRAEPLYQRSLKIYEDQLGRDHLHVASVLNSLALLYCSTGQYARAEPLYRRSLQIREDRLGKEHGQTAQSLNNLAFLYWHMGQYERAEPLYRQSLKLIEDRLGKDHVGVVLRLSNLGVLHAAQKHWQEAADDFEKARQVLNHYVHRVLPVLCEAEQLSFLKKNNNPSLYRALSLALLHAREDASLPGRSAAWLCNGKGLAQQSLAEQALLDRDARGPNAADVRHLREVRRQLAALSMSSPAPDQVQERLQTLDKLAEQEHELAGRMSRARGESQPTGTWLTLEQMRQSLPADSVFIDMARIAVYDFQASNKQHCWLPAHYIAWIILPVGKGDVQLIDLGEAKLIEQKVAGIQKALQQTPTKVTEQGEPESEKELGKLLQELAGLVLKPLEPHIGASKHWLLSPDGALWLAPWAALPLTDGSYAIEKHSLRCLISGRDLLRGAGKGSAMAAQLFADPDFNLAPSQRLASTRGLNTSGLDLSGLTLQGSIEERRFHFQLRADGRLFLREAESNRLAGQGSWQQQGDRLWMQTRVSQFQGQLQGQTIIGTRRKHQEDGSTVQDRWTAQVPGELLAAAPTWTVRTASSTQLELPPVDRLPGTAREAARVAPRLEQMTGRKPVLHLGVQASEGQLKAIEQPSILMLSTHGFFLSEQQMDRKEDHDLVEQADCEITELHDHAGSPLESPLRRCGLLLAGCNQRQKAAAGEDDGLLLGEEVLGLDLRGCEMVVLSACETGLGQVRNGEGVAGLRQAFQLAGAQSVLATLWQIPDRETAQLMDRFFEELAQGKDRAEALRQAQVSLIQARRKRYDAAHPYFWAAFTLTGQ